MEQTNPRGLAVRITVRESGKSGRRRKRRRRAELIRSWEGVHEIGIDVVTICQVRRQYDFLLIERISQLEGEVFAQRKAEARGKADRIRLVRDVAGRKLLPIEDVEARGHTITQEVRIHEGELGTFGVLPVLHRNLSVQAAAEQIAFGDADFSHEPICSRIAA